MTLTDILKNSPVDLSGVLRIADVAKTDKMIVAGDENTAVLTLLDCLGAGSPELAAVQQPCIVECISGAEAAITLTNTAGSIRCSSLGDLGVRLSWAENRNATAQIVVNHSLFGWEKLVFAILDGENFADQLSQAAAGATGAVIALDAFSAPSSQVYSYARWLAEGCALRSATAVMIFGPGEVFNTAPVMAIALQMGVDDLPAVTCNIREQSLAEALEQAVGCMQDKEKFDEAGLERTMAAQAFKRLEEEKKRLTSLNGEVAQPGMRFAERFEVEIPIARQKIQELISKEISNQLYSEMRDFAIYLQKNIVNLMVDGTERLQQQNDEENQANKVDTKAAIRAFSQSYLDSLISGYSEQLLNGLMQDQMFPKAKAIYDQMFERAWMASVDAGYLQIDELETQELHSTVGRMLQTGHLLLTVLLSSLVIYICPLLGTRRAIFKVFRVASSLVQEVQAALSPVNVIAKTKGKQLAEALNTIVGEYQDLVTETMVPQLRDGVLSWFDKQTEIALQMLKQYDEDVRRKHRQAVETADQNKEQLKSIDQTMDALKPWFK